MTDSRPAELLRGRDRLVQRGCDYAVGPCNQGQMAPSAGPVGHGGSPESASSRTDLLRRYRGTLSRRCSEGASRRLRHRPVRRWAKGFLLAACCSLKAPGVKVPDDFSVLGVDNIFGAIQRMRDGGPGPAHGLHPAHNQNPRPGSSPAYSTLRTTLIVRGSSGRLLAPAT